MPYDLREIAAISGMSGLYRLVRPAHNGVLVETLDEQSRRSVASARNKVSLLHEISIYTEDPDHTVPLTEVFDRVYQKYGKQLPVTSKSDDAALSKFMGEVVPEYDRQRVYMSDIKKLVTWYGAVSNRLEYQSAEAAAGDEAAAHAEETDATTDTLSTAGAVPAQTAGADNASENPEAGDTKPKRSRKKSE
ncbi:hypothetical protein F0P96_03205 [Hymenobacter busanensis]|uniref:Uncharacterized protein n=1 Tax=Hymenobacter busanensis TaxID=2607656 RepID=A0A7L4ZTZ4_9BACT|nr:DUF5606 domain-containing protein [Hymenobacter busanensis]KAA9339636.1 hypothetical protein F0P96_03205 [Hymenobacter busanensis]QHJ06608.1 hypothetical protein GUY19_04545 [Hymenobacter busanensis]